MGGVSGVGTPRRGGVKLSEAGWLATPGGEYNCVVRRSSTMNE